MKAVKKEKNTQYAVLGLGRFGMEIVKELSRNNCEVLAVDVKEENINAVANIATHAVIGDASEENVLKQIAIDSFDVVIIAIGQNMQASIVCALCCKELGCKYIIAKANSDKHATILKKIGVDKIIIPEAESAIRTATILLNPSVTEIIELEDGYSIAEIDLPQSWTGKKLMELRIRNKFNINVLLIIAASKQITSPEGNTELNEGDKLVIGGLSDDLNVFLAKNK